MSLSSNGVDDNFQFACVGQRNVINHLQGDYVSVYVPTTPNPTSGFLILVRESEITKLDVSVADGIKLIISLGAISPDSPSLGALKTKE